MGLPPAQAQQPPSKSFSTHSVQSPSGSSSFASNRQPSGQVHLRGGGRLLAVLPSARSVGAGSMGRLHGRQVRPVGPAAGGGPASAAGVGVLVANTCGVGAYIVG